MIPFSIVSEMSGLQETLQLDSYDRHTSPGRRKSDSAKMVNPLSIAFPLYIYPTVQTWTPLFNAIAANPSVNFSLVVNPNNGPGGPLPDLNYIECMSKLNAYDNVDLYGYVHTSWGARELSAIEADIANYEAWATVKNADIHVSGLFVDEAPSDTKYLDYMNTIDKQAKKVMTKGSRVWTNPGVPVDSRFYNAADIINAYENTFDYWTKHGGNTSIPAAQRAQSTVMIHGFKGTDAQLKTAVDAVKKDGYASAIITTDSSYTSFGTMWPDFVQFVAVAKASSSSTTSAAASKTTASKTASKPASSATATGAVRVLSSATPNLSTKGATSPAAKTSATKHAGS